MADEQDKSERNEKRSIQTFIPEPRKVLVAELAARIASNTALERNVTPERVATSSVSIAEAILKAVGL